MTRLQLRIALLTLCMGWHAPGDAAKLVPESLLDWSYVSDARWSPDGARLVYVRTRTNRDSDAYDPDIVLIDADRRERALSYARGADFHPRWAPDGRSIAFLSDRSGSLQVHVVPLDGGESYRVTAVDGHINAFAWSPDGQRLVIRFRPNGPAAEAGPARALVTTRLDIRTDGRAGYRPETRQRLGVIDLLDPTASVTLLTDGRYDDGVPVWSADGASVFFSAVRRTRDDLHFTDTDVYRVPADGSAAPAAVAARAGPDDQPLPSPDGRWLAVTGFAEREPQRSYTARRIRLIDLSGENPPRELGLAWPYAVGDTMAGDVNSPVPGGDNVQWSADSTQIYFTSAVTGGVQLVQLDVTTDSVRPVTSFDAGEIRSFDVSRTGQVAAVFSRPDVVQNLVSFSVGQGSRGAWRQLTTTNGELTDGVTFADYEEVVVERDGERRVQAWLIAPVRLDRRRSHPLLLYVHGGPHAMYGTNFFHELQILANAGYFVLIANPIGSAGYGEAFANAVQFEYPGEDRDDLLAVLDVALERRDIDARRIGIAGGSGGGLLAASLIGSTNRFRAASIQRAVTNWLSFVGTSDYNVYFAERWFRDFPWNDAAAHLENSPISRVGSVSAPVQVMHGDADFRVPFGQGLEYYTALRLLDKPAELVVFPGESHGLSRAGRPSMRVQRLQHLLRWFDAQLRD